jgi:hypothetical protein
MMVGMHPSTSAAVDCPLARGLRANTYSRALHRACLIVGGVGPLAAQLKVQEAALRNWLEGVGEPPLEIFLATVEILLLNAGDAGRA